MLNDELVRQVASIWLTSKRVSSARAWRGIIGRGQNRDWIYLDPPSQEVLDSITDLASAKLAVERAAVEAALINGA